MRLADIRLRRRPIEWLKAIFPVYGLFLLWLRRRNQSTSADGVEQIAREARKLVDEAQQGARVLRRMTAWLILLTIANTAFVIYSAVK